ncbi:DUF4037 domain-containing protein [Flexivirga oryzae]|uniref:DUF4037 domain-containing protein n=1 Tax=Flexivirga oryzae TaxID=1794944 RepID=A0A839N7J9_9MICO|nr:DUF4037 domain-containing protein [Flexivirga oryzae]MBB2893750.1 hypothetical protein [Flexivirga oryzae]
MDGRALSRAYFEDVVAPLLARRFPGLRYAAARLGTGSDVLGFDDAVSQDHDFGLRLTLLTPHDRINEVVESLDAELPADYRDWPTRFSTSWARDARPQIEVTSASDFGRSRLGVDATAPLSVTDWLSLTGQAVLEVTGGPVFADGAGELTAMRQRLEWYPHDLWLHLLACDWTQAGEELSFVGRSASRGDDLGSRVLAGRLAHVGMHLGFLLERRWPPYSKWLGTAFARLPRASAALPGFRAAVAAPTWQEREDGLAEGFAALGRLQGELGLPATEPVTVPHFDRPFRRVADIARLLLEEIVDADVRALPYGVGNIEQVSAATKVLVDARRRRDLMSSLTTGGAG